MGRQKRSETVIEEFPPESEAPPESSSFDASRMAAVDESGAKAAYLLSTLAVGQGYWFKIYKQPTEPNKPLEFICSLELNHPIEDLDLELQKIVQHYKSGSGEYIIRTHCHGKPGLQAEALVVYITQPPLLPGQGSVDGQQTAGRDQFQGAVEIMKTAKEMVAPLIPSSQGGSSDVGALATAITSAISAGILAVKDASSQSNILEKLISSKEVMTSIAALIKEFRPKEVTMGEVLAQLKQLGFLPENREQTHLSQVKSFAETVEIVRALTPESGGKSSTAAEVLRALSPHIGDALATIREGMDLARRRMGQGQQIEPAKPPAEAPPTQVQPPDVTNHPFMIELKTAIEAKDQNYFPKLVHGIGYWVENGDQYLQAAVQGTMSPEEVQSFLASMGGEYFNQGKAKEYLVSFLGWYRKYLQAVAGTEQPETAPPEGKQILASCVRCGETYEFYDAEHWMQDGKICDQVTEAGPCGGDLKLLSEIPTTKRTQ